MTTRPAAGDPVRVLLRSHRALCERAVDPLEIAAGLEASGVTDRTAARCRHRDVFSLAEEMYARAPHPEAHAGPFTETYAGPVPHAPAGPPAGPPAGSPAGPRAPGDTRRSTGAMGAEWSSYRGAPLVLPLLPALLCAGTLAWLVLFGGSHAAVWATLCAVGAAVVLGSVIVAVRLVPRVPPAVGTAGFPTGLFLCACWLTGYALYGDRLLEGQLGGGPESLGGPGFPSPGIPSPGVAFGLSLAVAPAVWCARGFALAARRRLAGSRSLEEFASGVRPLLALAVCAVAVSLPALQWAAHALVGGPLGLFGADGAPAGGADPLAGWQSAAAGAAACGMLLFAALLLTAHGFRHAAFAGLASACALEALALLSVPAARLPGLAVLGRPVELLVAHHSATALPVAACGCAALVLLAYAATVLAGASAHHREAVPA
ncbi:hypothetical protein [Streptomyces spirodelae]|uniref:Integral membrane protein n=1 Tax=Streptomyces spirodelae TaxID=2812904 RepID=A0ABS3WV15_9ACTN|nr:hypothetical protein [Streptomyces spirodelae]MBO8186980.1 hypothetical protein [Streptomyces spirodelae]